jgi:hypothetical protein
MARLATATSWPTRPRQSGDRPNGLRGETVRWRAVSAGRLDRDVISLPNVSIVIWLAPQAKPRPPPNAAKMLINRNILAAVEASTHAPKQIHRLAVQQLV